MRSAAFIAGVLVVVSPVWAGSAVLVASEDNTLFEDDAGALSNGAGSFLFAGRTADDTLRRGLLAFDVAGAVPPGAIISSATLSLTMSRTIVGEQDVSVHRVLASWGEGTSVAGRGEGEGAPATPGDATWLHRFFDTLGWAKAGGDFDPAPSAVESVGGIDRYVWDSTPRMVADVQAWLDDPAQNFGWLLLAEDEAGVTAKRFNSRSNEDEETRPMLIVTFSERAEAPVLSGSSVLLVLLSFAVIARRRLRAPLRG